MGARSITPKMSLSEMEGEILFTRAALKADPDAEDLLAMTDPWLGMLDEPRRLAVLYRQAVADADGARAVSNHRLDRVCIGFGDELFLECKKDRKATRWVQHFSSAVSRFVRIALATQVATVRGWLRGSTDPVLEHHRAELTRWSDRAWDAVEATKATAGSRGAAWIAREALAEGLTANRDGLWEALAARARERGLEREWPDVFFRTTPRRAGRGSSEADDTTSEPTGTDGE